MGFMPLGSFGNVLRTSSSISFDNLISGLATAQQFVIAGGTNGYMRSQNYNTTDEGWALFGDGTAKLLGSALFGDGTAVLPGMAFASDPDTGIFRVNTNDLGFAVGGFLAFHFTSTSIFTGVLFRGIDAGAGLPMYSFKDDTNTGMYRVGTDNLGFAAAGGLKFRVDSRGLHTGATSSGLATWSTSSIEIGDFGHVGSQGSFRMGIAWNWERVSDSSYVNKAVNAYTSMGSIAIGDVGIRFEYDDDNANPSGPPGLRVFINEDGVNLTSHATTGSAANAFIVTAGGQIKRSTSARKDKSRINYNMAHLADITLKPVKFYRKDDHAWYLGFIADDLADEDKLIGEYSDGEIENYDLRAVVAVLAAKVNRLEAESQGS